MTKALAKIETQQSAELISLNAIRNETVLSRFPFHRLGKKGNSNIEIKSKDEHGSIIWKVTYNSGYGQPGPLAYKVDTLIVNRRIDEARQEGLPKILKLGSLREICRELGLNEGQATREVKNALYQNAFAAIVTKQTYTASDGSEQTFEFGDTRYGVVFTGEELPSGQKADAVYIVLHDLFMSLLKAAKTRPLDYDYLKALPPSAQRFYKLLSFEMFAAVMYRHRAKLVYSDYCIHAPQIRYFQYKRMNQQMRDIHDLHIKAGYIEDVEYRTITDSAGNPDWEILYTPGPKARADYKAATNKADRAKTTVDTLPKAKILSKKEDAISPSVESNPQHENALVQELINNGLAHLIAVKLATEKPDECRRQLELLPHQNIKGSKAGFLRRAIEEGYGAPARYEQEKTRKSKEVDQKAQQEAQAARRATIVEELGRMVGRLYQSHREAYKNVAQFIEESAERDLKKYKETSPFYKAIAEAYDGQAKPLEMLIEYFAKNPCPLQELAEFINAQKPDRLKQLIRAHFDSQKK